MKKRRKSKDKLFHFGLNDLLITLGALAGLAFGIWYFRRNPQEAEIFVSRTGHNSGDGDIFATLYYMALGGALGELAYMGYEKWKNRRK